MTTPIIQFDLSQFVPRIQEYVNKVDAAIDTVAYGLLADAGKDLHAATTRFRRPLILVPYRRKTGTWDLICYDVRFMWLNAGTEPHTIPARTPKGMTFQWAASRKPGRHIAKTRPRSLSPGAGTGDTYRGGSAPVVGAQTVSHPGIKARNYTGILTRKYKKEVYTRVVQALRNL